MLDTAPGSHDIFVSAPPIIKSWLSTSFKATAMPGAWHVRTPLATSILRRETLELEDLDSLAHKFHSPSICKVDSSEQSPASALD